jgi:hypothetical protein
MEVQDLKGMKGFRAFQAFHKIMLGLKMLPAYLHESYEDFFDRAAAMPEADQERLVREACLFVDLESSEVESLLSHCEDANGVPVSASHIKTMAPDQILEGLVAVCKTVIRIRVDFIGEDQKKN